LAELRIAWPVRPAVLLGLIGQAIVRNGLREATVYVQVGRGVAPRHHLFPKAARPTLTITVRRAAFPSRRDIEDGVRVVTMPDPRWARRDIKAVALLPNVLCRQAAAEAGCREAWFVDTAGFVTEGSGSNAYIVDGEGRLVTRPLGPEILGGVTRSVVLDLALAAGIEVVERPFSVEEAHGAREALLSSTTSLLLPVVEIDGRPVANGAPGEVGRQLLRLYAEREGLPARLWP
jgi:D-alanine transaminase